MSGAQDPGSIAASSLAAWQRQPPPQRPEQAAAVSSWCENYTRQLRENMSRGRAVARRVAVGRTRPGAYRPRRPSPGARAVWKSTHVLQPAKKLNNSAVSKPRAEGERRKILDLFFDAKTIQNPSERRKISSKKYGARSAPEKNSNMLLSKVQNTKRARIFQNLDFHAGTHPLPVFQKLGTRENRYLGYDTLRVE